MNLYLWKIRHFNEARLLRNEVFGPLVGVRGKCRGFLKNLPPLSSLELMGCSGYPSATMVPRCANLQGSRYQNVAAAKLPLARVSYPASCNKTLNSGRDCSSHSIPHWLKTRILSPKHSNECENTNYQW